MNAKTERRHLTPVAAPSGHRRAQRLAWILVLAACGCGDDGTADASTAGDSTGDTGATSTSTTSASTTSTATTGMSTSDASSTSGPGTSSESSSGTGDSTSTTSSTSTDSGSTGDAVCPTAVIDVAQGTDVDFGTMLELSAAGSMANGDAVIASYAWSVVQPPGSAEVLDPADAEDITFTPFVLGDYTFELVVTDDDGIESCEAASVTVSVHTPASIHVELVWDSPGDPDPHDFEGTDIDLHFTHPLADAGADFDDDGQPDPYYDTDFDCFWFNANPDWGTPAASDDANLVVDDVNGLGPEITTLEAPEDLTYRVAAHYWNDNGFGASSATARVYVDDALAYESTASVDQLDMWCIAEVQWPSGTVTPCTGPMAEDPWITPNYCNPFFIPCP